MSNKRKGQTAICRQWARHLRPFWKRQFWGRQRRDDDQMSKESDSESADPLVDWKKYQKKYGIRVQKHLIGLGGRIYWSYFVNHSWYSTPQRRDEAIKNLMDQDSGNVYEAVDR